MRTSAARLLPPVLVVLLALAGSARACNTPVYRYAMYNWPPSPFGLFYLHDGPIPEADAKTHRTVKALLEERADMPNLVFRAVDAADAKTLDNQPKLVKEAWAGRPKDAKNLYVLVSPLGAVLLKGRLSEKEAATLIDSPARKQLGELLNEGRAGVLVVLATADVKRTQQVEEAVDKIVEMVASGEISSPLDQTTPADPAAPKDDAAKADEPATPSKTPARIARITIARSDPAEAWLIKQLMATEEGLDELAKEPMVFAVFGRGRAMPPCVGKGINSENLTDCVTFLMGACSCLIKDQNPGADLLMAWDWEATSASLAAKEDDANDPRAGGYREVAATMDESPRPGPVIFTSSKKEAPADADKPAKPADKAANATPPAATGEKAGPARPADPKASVEKPAETAAPAAEGYWRRHLWLYGAALGGAAVVVLLVGLMSSRR